MSSSKKKISVFGSLKLGIGDYLAHLYRPLSSISDVQVLSFSHMAMGDAVDPRDSELVFSNIPEPKLVVCPNTFETLAQSYITLRDELNQFNPDAFNLHVSSFLRVLHYFFYEQIVSLREKGVQIIYTLHDVLPKNEKNVDNSILNKFYQLADLLIVGNELEKARLEENFSIKNPVIVGKHGVYDLYDKDKYTITSARSKLGIGRDEFIILFFGLIREDKGIEDLLQAFSHLTEEPKSRGMNIKLYIAGSVRNGSEAKKIYETLVRQQSLEEKVILQIREKEIFHAEEIELLFKACNVVVLPYAEASQSGVLSLTIGFKKPMITTSAFAEADEIDEKLGLVVPMQRQEMLSKAMIQMVNNYSNYEKLALKNSVNYSKNHSWEKLARQIVDQIE